MSSPGSDAVPMEAGTSADQVTCGSGLVTATQHQGGASSHDQECGDSAEEHAVGTRTGQGFVAVLGGLTAGPVLRRGVLGVRAQVVALVGPSLVLAGLVLASLGLLVSTGLLVAAGIGVAVASAVVAATVVLGGLLLAGLLLGGLVTAGLLVAATVVLRSRALSGVLLSGLLLSALTLGG